MTFANIQQEVYQILQDMGLSQKAITNKASFQKDLGLDSLDFAELFMEVELRFQIDISILEMEKMTTVIDIVNYLYELNQSFSYEE